MLTKEELTKITKKHLKESREWNEEKLKEEFIKNFGPEKWCEEEMLSKLIPLSMEVSDFLGIDTYPILFEKLDDDSRVYFKEEYIAINEKYKDNYTECAKCLVHELRHIYQLFYVAESSEEKALRMKEELALLSNLNPHDPVYSFQEIEIDAYAFTKWYLKKYKDIDAIHPSKDYELLITAYMNKYFD